LKIARLSPAPGISIAFDYVTVRAIAPGPGCYVLTNAGGDIVYIGQAVSLRTRLLQHLNAGRHLELTPYGRASLVAVVAISSPLYLNAHERGWIDQCELADGFLPPLNKVHGPL
jgi:hypothetical protein